MTPASPRPWCVLIHVLPAKPLYLRARVRRQLARVGAAPLKNAVYVLPDSEQGLEHMRAIAADIEAAGASAFVCQATFPDPKTENVVLRAYNDEVERRPGGRASAQARGGDLAGRRWVTRKGLHVDRLACAWLVRRFIDPSAGFRFVSSPGAPLARNEIGFDMPGAEITHEDGRCSVEALVRRAGVTDPAVLRIAEIVHDIDLKDGHHGHAETAGFEQLLLGTIASHPRDDDRLERGIALFDALYAAAAGPRRTPRLAMSASSRSAKKTRA